MGNRFRLLFDFFNFSSYFFVRARALETLQHRVMSSDRVASSRARSAANAYIYIDMRTRIRHTSGRLKTG
jgi:hypothetical protein